jgi:hypothetical protein
MIHHLHKGNAVVHLQFDNMGVAIDAEKFQAEPVADAVVFRFTIPPPATR